MRNIKVVDYTFGRKSSDDVDTSLPFTENFKEAKTIQQANAVICAYVNANYKDIQDKQDKLVSGENIKTINNESILGDGNIDVISDVSWGDITGDIQDQADLQSALDDKQDTLIGTETTGQNIKTINGNSILGTGDLNVSASASWGDITGDIQDQTDLQSALDDKQDTLIGTETTGQNIKTINGNSILGTGDLNVSASASWGDITGDIQDQTDLQSALDDKQDTLIGTETTGQNIKTINNNSLLGSGDIDINSIIGNSLSIQTESINVGSFAANEEKFNQTYNVIIPSGYSCLGILGWYLTGGGYTNIFTNKMWFDNTNSQIAWSLSNGRGSATVEITLTVKLLLVKNTNS